MVELSDPEREQDRNSVAGGPIIITCSDDSSDGEVGDMGKSLRELMSSRGKGQSSKAPAKAQTQDPPPIAPQVPSDPGLKVNPDLKKKRQADIPKEGEVTFQPTKQQKTTRTPRSRRGNSTESRDEENLAEVRTTPRT